jgi:hypothetical protein
LAVDRSQKKRVKKLGGIRVRERKTDGLGPNRQNALRLGLLAASGTGLKNAAFSKLIQRMSKIAVQVQSSSRDLPNTSPFSA